ncbi:MAG: hypothetical protein WCH34_16945 [Bacteroidota bacterium]
MDNLQQAEMSRNLNFKTQMANDALIYQNNPAMVQAVADFNAANDINLQCASEAHPNNSGYSDEKRKYKKSLSKMASNLSGKAWVKLTALGKTAVADKLFVNPNDFFSLADSAFIALCTGAYDIMLANITDLKPDYVTDANLVTLHNNINTFSGLQGTSDLVHEASPLLTKAFEESFKPVRQAIEVAKLLVRDYDDEDYADYNPEFYKRTMASTHLPVVNVHHTFVNIVALDKITGKAIEGILFTLTNAKKSGSTDWEGKLTLERPKAGKDILTGVLNGKVVYLEHIEIKRGTNNDFNLELTIVNEN